MGMTADEAEAFAGRFAALADPLRVRLLHVVAAAGREVSVAGLAGQLDADPAGCARHVEVLADAGFVTIRGEGRTTLVSADLGSCARVPHPADVVLGLLPTRPWPPGDLPDDVLVRPLADGDWDDVRRVYAEGIATGHATFETEVPDRGALEAGWLPGHRWVAEVDGSVAGWAAAKPVSARPVYAGVAETSLYVGDGFRGRGVGKALVHGQVTAADSGGLWTLQTAIFPENRASLNLHRSAGFRTLAVRDRIGLHHGVWRDTVLLERRRDGD